MQLCDLLAVHVGCSCASSPCAAFVRVQATFIPALSPAAFLPLVRRCAAARPYAVRQLAARALPPLLFSEAMLQLDQHSGLRELLACLPGAEATAAGACVRVCLCVCLCSEAMLQLDQHSGLRELLA